MPMHILWKCSAPLLITFSQQQQQQQQQLLISALISFFNSVFDQLIHADKKKSGCSGRSLFMNHAKEKVN